MHIPPARPQVLEKQDDGEEEAIDIINMEKNELDHVPDADDDDEELLFLPTVPEVEGTRPPGGPEGGEGEEGGKAKVGGKRKAGQ